MGRGRLKGASPSKRAPKGVLEKHRSRHPPGEGRLAPPLSTPLLLTGPLDLASVGPVLAGGGDRGSEDRWLCTPGMGRRAPRPLTPYDDSGLGSENRLGGTCMAPRRSPPPPAGEGPLKGLRRNTGIGSHPVKGLLAPPFATPLLLLGPWTLLSVGPVLAGGGDRSSGDRWRALLGWVGGSPYLILCCLV